MNIKILNRNVEKYYREYEQKFSADSGVDLVCPEDIVIPSCLDSIQRATKIKLGVACQRTDQIAGYDLRARSSISKTPLILANSVGTIDYGYRGEIMAAVHNISPSPFVVKAGTKLFQLCLPSLVPFEFKLVDELDDTQRGQDGFGSTGIIAQK